ncbi:dimethylamine methyltransferase [Candidatus Formimonas warabiya]|uniref:Dimethylamine methyltransferase n=1 Tax=Formimonas warabiya TaxID=1761012 RepID=A0A3G1KPN4_FORW1|nr:dimethylamine methyltransferase [Candidatus Formimonas warabiya]
MEITHEMAAGMGGIRTAGDLVARVQLSKAMKIDAAKQYVAEKLAISRAELADPIVMGELRADLDIGRVQPPDGAAIGIEAKFNIARLLDIRINSVTKFMALARIK